MKANKYITPVMKQIELGSHAIATPIGTSKTVDETFSKKDNAWDDTDSESEW